MSLFEVKLRNKKTGEMYTHLIKASSIDNAITTVQSSHYERYKIHEDSLIPSVELVSAELVKNNP